MTRKNIEHEIKKLISKCFNLEIKKIKTSLNSKNVKKWDSIGQIRLILMIESKFKIKINSKKYSEMNSLNFIVNYISKST